MSDKLEHSSAIEYGRHVSARTLANIGDAISKNMARLARFMSILGSIFAMLMAFLLVFAVISRHLFNYPIPGGH